MKLFKFQETGVEEILRLFKTHRLVCLAWYTGAGKTNVLVEFCRALIKENPNVKIGISAYLTREIKEQVSDRLKAYGLGDKTWTFENGKTYDKTKNIFVFNPQTIYRNPPELQFDYYVVDESHAAVSDDHSMFPKITTKTCSKKTKMLLISATPWDTLARKQFKDAPVLKRPLDQGLRDGLITDFKFHAEEAMITFTEKDFTRQGDLGSSSAMRQMAILKSACLGKLEYLLKNYDKEIGKKCLVICPPGNFSEVARTFAERYNNGLAFIQTETRIARNTIEHWQNTNDNLREFKTKEKFRFLFVTNKCGVGFDMKDLDSVIDLTMTRNIKTLAQRCGRVARKNGNKEKHYFYVYDQSLMKDRLEWLVTTMIDFCLGAYDGWTTKTAKYRKTSISSQWALKHPFCTTVSEVVAALRNDGLIENRRSLAYVTGSGPPTKWTLDRALDEAQKWSSRTEMWEKQPALYKWFRLNAKAEMDRIFPMKNHLGKWNERTVTATLEKNCGMARKKFRIAYPGALWWVQKHNRHDLFDKYLAPSTTTREWNEKSIMKLIRSLRTWSHMRTYSGARRWMSEHKGEMFWRRKWEESKGRHFKGRESLPPVYKHRKVRKVS